MKVIAKHKYRGTEYMYVKETKSPEIYQVSTLRGFPQIWAIYSRDIIILDKDKVKKSLVDLLEIK